jgi:cytidyltransferase-like protein
MDCLKTVVVSGYFDPLHVGHIEYLELAKSLGGRLIVIVNNDKQATLKKGEPFMGQEDRLVIVGALRCVDNVFLSIDNGKDVCESLAFLKPDIFANGGDRANREIPEAKVCDQLGITLVDGLGTKIRSSSDYTGLK